MYVLLVDPLNSLYLPLSSKIFNVKLAATIHDHQVSALELVCRQNPTLFGIHEKLAFLALGRQQIFLRNSSFSWIAEETADLVSIVGKKNNMLPATAI